uniref:hypothetical protein n=1 Tax=Pedobacter schmidteae TaxID=2201271 RepID=UPI000EABB2A9|nr:hypothetical protein [Pedobacter schmidteae]
MRESIKINYLLLYSGSLEEFNNVYYKYRAWICVVLLSQGFSENDTNVIVDDFFISLSKNQTLSKPTFTNDEELKEFLYTELSSHVYKKMNGSNKIEEMFIAMWQYLGSKKSP